MSKGYARLCPPVGLPGGTLFSSDKVALYTILEMYLAIVSGYKHGLVHGRKVIIHWSHAKFLPLINRSVNQPP